ncbi:MAG: V-type ATP synthase subunit I [Acutalibacteraceae bacterium]
MAVEKMKLLSILGPYDKLDEALKVCIESDSFQPENAAEFMGNSEGFSYLNEENPYSFRLMKIKEIFEHFNKKPEFVSDCEDTDIDEANRRTDALYETIKSIKEHDSKVDGKIEETKRTIEQLSHFEHLDINLDDVFNCDYIRVRFGRLPFDSFEKLKKYNKDISSIFYPDSSDDVGYWGLYVTPIDKTDEVDRVYASLFFERLRLPGSHGTPEQTLKQLREELKTMEESKKEIDESDDIYFEEHIDLFNRYYSKIKSLSDSFEARKYAAKYHSSFFLAGWVPVKSEKKLTDALGKIEGVEVESANAKDVKRLTPPTKMKNSPLTRAFKFFTEIYGVPSYNEIDPTPLIAVVYTLLYGIMFADLGQGFVLAIVGILMYKLKGMRLGKILVPCGISGMFFGTVFGSVFGNEELLNPMFHALGFEEKPIEIMSSALMFIIASIVIGVLVIIVSMLFNVFSSFKKRDFGSAIFGHNGICGIVLYSSLILLLINMFASLGINTKALAIGGILVPIILIFLKTPLGELVGGRKPKIGSASDFIIENFFELFEVILSYMSNTLSFLRVGAFVLIHACMMSTFSALAGITGGGVAAVIIMIFGNIFVIALEGLLVGIQVLRLNFYEIFSRFYDGDGKPFTPLTINQ